MQDYTSSTYGEAFADVYDDWYADLDDPLAWRDAVIAALPDELLPVLELGVGTGRLAVPLAAAGYIVHGVDTSAAMLERVPAGDHRARLHLHRGDMVDDLPPGPFGVIFCGFNTFFNLLSEQRQQDAMHAVARRLSDGGVFIVDTAIFTDDGDDTDSAVELRSMTADQVVLSVSRARSAEQRAEGHFIDLSNGGIRLRPWAIRWSTPTQLDRLAAAAGLTLVERTADLAGTPLSPLSTRQISRYRRAGNAIRGTVPDRS